MELEFDISGRDPLDRAADEAEYDEGDTSTQSPIHHEDDNEEQEDDMDNLSERRETNQSSTSTQQALGQTSDSWDLDDFLPAPSPKLNMEPDSHPYEFFCKIWGEETFQELAEQTNLYALQKGTATWVNTNEEEMKSFLGIHLAMGLVRLPSLKDYWSTNPLLATPGIVKGMSRNRFRSILSHLHVNDNSQMPRPGSPNFDKLFKLRPLLNKIRLNSQRAYQLHQQLAVDEAMVLFKGRSSLTQYLPKKPTKWGFKCWCT